MTGARLRSSAFMLRKTLGRPSRIGARASGKARVSGIRYAFARAIIVPVGFGTVWISLPPSAMADPSGGDAKQEPTGSQNAPDESDSTNNGNDLYGLKILSKRV